MSESKNIIRFGERFVDLDEVKNDSDLDNVVDITCMILASTIVFGSSGIKETEPRAEFILKKSASLAAEIARRAIIIAGLESEDKKGKMSDA